MTESLNDNNPTVDKLVYNIELDDKTLTSDVEGDDDFFICRKCNKVFKNLPEYLEHKVKDENYRISQMRSKVDRRMVFPQLVQRQKRQRKKTKKTQEKEGKTKTVAASSEADSSNSQQVPQAGTESLSENQNELQTQGLSLESEQENVSHIKEKNKKVSVTTTLTQSVSGDNTYICKVCERKFRREATLRWHMKYDHKSKEDDSDNSESSENELMREELAERDEDFNVMTEKEGRDDPQFQVSTGGKSFQEIHVIIEQPENGKDQGRKEKEDEKKTAEETQREKKKKASKQMEEGKNGPREKPFTCNICGREFKELTVLKAHGVVHSDDRKYRCGFENCPYGFKTKGGLVRHMRRHTGERPYACERCGRSFSESGALTRHMKARRNCSKTPDSAYPRYMKNWTYHPNIPAVIDPEQRDALRGRSTLPQPQTSVQGVTAVEQEEGEIHYIITDAAGSNIVKTEIIASDIAEVGIEPGMVVTDIVGSQLVTEGDSVVEIKQDKGDTEEWSTETGEVEINSDVNTMAGTEIVSSVLKTQESALQTEIHDSATASNLEQHVTSVEVSERQDVKTDSHSAMDKTEDSELLELKNNAIDVELLKPTQCHVCKKDLEAIEGLEIHLRSHLADQASGCGLCHFMAQDREELRQHILSMHYDSLNDIEASVLAMEEEEGGTTKPGTLQNRKSVLRDALVAVKQLYSLKKNKGPSEINKPGPSATLSLQCMVCNRFFRGSSYLRQHMRTHTGDRPHQCQHCNRSFTSRDILKKHMYVHKEQRDFKCGECGKLFKRLAHVQQHLRIHSQERSFRCTVCEKLFKTQNSLKVHLRTHSGVNPYKCQVCSRHFRERGSLQRHMRLHTGEKPYKCPLCHRGFAEQGTLSRHLKAKMPCSSTRDATHVDSNQSSNTTMLAQFSSMVADTQQYILPEVDGGHQYILPAVQDQEMNEDYVVLQTTGEGSEEVVENIEVITQEEMVPSSGSDGVFSGEQAQETLQIIDSSTGESLIIVADKSIADLVRNQQLSLESGEGGSSLQKIKDILFAAGEGYITTTTAIEQGESVGVEELSTASEQENISSIKEETEVLENEKIESEIVEELTPTSKGGAVSIVFEEGQVQAKIEQEEI